METNRELESDVGAAVQHHAHGLNLVKGQRRGLHGGDQDLIDDLHGDAAWTHVKYRSVVDYETQIAKRVIAPGGNGRQIDKERIRWRWGLRDFDCLRQPRA